MPVMQNVGQCFHTRPHAVSGRTLLARCNIRVSASHRLPTPLALPGFHRLRRTSGSRGAEMSVVKTISGLASPNSPPQHGQPAATTGTVVVLLSFPAVLSGSENIPGPASGPAPSDSTCAYLWKTEPPSPLFRLPNIRPELLDQAMLIENDLDQFLPSQ
jgi:hypothetical protein